MTKGLNEYFTYNVVKEEILGAASLINLHKMKIGM